MAVKTPAAPKSSKIVKNAKTSAPAAAPVKTPASSPAPKDSAPIFWDDAMDFFSVGTDSGRLNILYYLDQNGETNVGDLTAHAKTTQPAMSASLAILRRDRMVRARRDGKNVFYSITDQGKRLIALALSIVNA